MISQYDKAIAALIVSVVVLLAGHYGFHFSIETQTAMSTLATGLVVYWVPNKSA